MIVNEEFINEISNISEPLDGESKKIRDIYKIKNLVFTKIVVFTINYLT